MRLRVSRLVLLAAAACTLFAQSLAQAQLLSSSRINSKWNDRPVFGILTQPTSSTFGTSYLTASYVKWLESAGARVMPVHYARGEAYFADILSRVDGVLLPGGDLALNDTTTPYWDRVRQVLAFATSHDDFVLWGTCQGFQQLSMATSSNPQNTWGYFGAENISLPLDFIPEAHASRMFGDAPQHIFETFAKQPVTQNLHHEGVAPERFTSDPKLAEFWQVLSTNIAPQNGRTFVSSIEAKNHRIFATQFHPERNQFEWEPTQNINHSYEAIQCSQWLANFVVEQARRSQASLRNPPQPKELIGAFCALQTYDMDGWIDDNNYFWKL